MKPVAGLSLKEVGYAPDRKLILQGISLDVSPGRFVGILGPNGAGKSTLLRIVAAVLPASSGVVSLDGQALGEWSSPERARRLAYVPQRTGVPFPFRAYEVVLMGRTPHLGRWQKERAEDFRIVDEAMTLTDTTHLAERDVMTLSGGEMQRVALARALAQKPAFLLLDEPMASLDLRHQLEILDVIAGLVGKGITVLAALHDLNLAAAYCSEIVLLREGGVYAAGPPKAVLTPESLRVVFGVEVFLGANPVTGSLYVVPLQSKTGTETT